MIFAINNHMILVVRLAVKIKKCLKNLLKNFICFTRSLLDEYLTWLWNAEFCRQQAIESWKNWIAIALLFFADLKSHLNLRKNGMIYMQLA